MFSCVGGGGGGIGIGRLAGGRGIISSAQWEEVSNSFFLSLQSLDFGVN